MNENANEKPTELDVLEKIIDNGLKDIEREIARLKDMSKKHLEDVIYKNSLRLLNIDE